MAANARGAAQRPTVTEATGVPALTRLQRRARQIYRFLAATFITGLTLQVFIVGIALFVDGGRWDIHQRLGHALILIPILMLGLAFAGRMTAWTRLLTIIPVVLAILQMITAIVGGWAGAIHPVNALLLIAIGMHLFQRTTRSRPDSTRNQTSEERSHLSDSSS